MTSEIWIYLLAFSASLVAGTINTLAGNGSSLTLAVLMGVAGLSPKEANATIRVGVLSAALSALPTFYGKGYIRLSKEISKVLALVFGAVIGIFIALYIDNHSFKEVFKYLFILMLFFALFKPERWIQENQVEPGSSYLLIFLYFLLGVYGGFVQMGLGVFFLFVAVWFEKKNIIQASALRTICIGLFSPIAILIFAYFGLVRWDFAFFMAIGEGIGGRVGSILATQYKNAAVYAHRLLIIVLVVAIFQSFW